MPYTWATFIDEVRGHFPVDSPRLNVGVAAPGRSVSWLELQVRQAVIDIQKRVEAYRIGHESVYFPPDFVMEGVASRATLPPGAEVNDGYLVQIVNTERANRFPLTPFDWRQRMSLVHGHVPVNDGQARFCVDPESYTFYVYPRVMDGWVVSLNWNGLKTDFENDEETPFDEQMVGAVAEFVKAMIAKDVNNDGPMFSLVMNPQNPVGYPARLRGLYLTAQAKKGKF